MKQSVRLALATGALAVVGGLFLAGTSLAGGGLGHHGHGGMMGPLGHEMLRGIDTNGDQALSQEEIDAAINGRFAEFDENSDGTLSLVEFQALFAEITRPISVRAFQFLDPDGDAGIAKAELADRFGAVVVSFDRNDDGMLSRDDRPRHRRFWGGGHGGEESAEE